MTKKLFLVGPGFIGGSLLVKLKQVRPDLELSALTRRDDQAKELKDLGITPIKGGLNDSATIKKAASEADIIIHTATADDVASALAIVDGIKSRSNKEKKQVYIHTSGNDELAFSAKNLAGKSVKERTLSDGKGDETLENGRILPDAFHRHVDGPLREKLFNYESEKENNVSTTIIMPPTIYGIGSEPWKRISIQIPMIVSSMLKNGLATFSKDFKGSWNSVWIHDLVDAYIVLLNQLENHIPGENLPSHYLFPAEREPFSWKEIFDEIINQLQKHNVKGDVKTFKDKTDFEKWIGGKENPYSPCFGQITFGIDNSYTYPERLENLNFQWQHKGGLITSIKNGEIEDFIKKELNQ